MLVCMNDVQVRTFDQWVATIKGKLAEVSIAFRHSIIRAHGFGSALVEAKAAVEHGQWLPLLEACEIPSSTAHRYMQVAERPLDGLLKHGIATMTAALLTDATGRPAEPVDEPEPEPVKVVDTVPDRQPAAVDRNVGVLADEPAEVEGTVQDAPADEPPAEPKAKRRSNVRTKDELLSELRGENLALESKVTDLELAVQRLEGEVIELQANLRNREAIIQQLQGVRDEVVADLQRPA